MLYETAYVSQQLQDSTSNRDWLTDFLVKVLYCTNKKSKDSYDRMLLTFFLKYSTKTPAAQER